MPIKFPPTHIQYQAQKVERLTPTTMAVIMSFVLVGVSLILIANATPNILFILAGKCCSTAHVATALAVQFADDLGYGDIGVYPNPNTTHGRLDTPNLNTLAGQSVMFTDGYAGAPVCAPSRCTLVGDVRSHAHAVTSDDPM